MSRKKDELKIRNQGACDEKRSKAELALAGRFEKKRGRKMDTGTMLNR